MIQNIFFSFVKNDKEQSSFLTEGWTWSDKTPYDYSNWGENEPNQQYTEECVEIYPWNGKWNDVSCSEKRGFICKRPKGWFL